jgi:hypothetical protein
VGAIISNPKNTNAFANKAEIKERLHNFCFDCRFEIVVNDIPAFKMIKNSLTSTLSDSRQFILSDCRQFVKRQE